jgi:hypothetical protein
MVFLEPAANRELAFVPYLATCLGHKDINSTLVYLTVTQNLPQQASERFRVRGARLLQPLTVGNA